MQVALDSVAAVAEAANKVAIAKRILNFKIDYKQESLTALLNY